MSAAHTPGPWGICREPNQDTTRRFIWNDEYSAGHVDSPHGDTGYCVATVQPRGDEAVLEANAALIAAAPEMLAALLAFVHKADARGHDSPELGLARAVIDKAQGRS